jgi:hypothetical protein
MMAAVGRSRRGERTAVVAGCLVEEYVEVCRSVSTGRMSKVRESHKEAGVVAVAGTEAGVEDEQQPPKRLSCKRTRHSCRVLNS